MFKKNRPQKPLTMKVMELPLFEHRMRKGEVPLSEFLVSISHRKVEHLSFKEFMRRRHAGHR